MCSFLLGGNGQDLADVDDVRIGELVGLGQLGVERAGAVELVGDVPQAVARDDGVGIALGHGCLLYTSLQDHGILGPKTILGHCIHVNTAEMEIIKETGTMVVNNPESNMGNAIGICPVLQLYKRGILLGMGTDAYTCLLYTSRCV